jgi:nicotinamidase-related amidase
MTLKNPNLHGNTPDTSDTVLLIIDMINDLEFEGGDILLPKAKKTADTIAELKIKAQEHHVPTIYINDNFGRWQSDFTKQISHCLEDISRGKYLVQRLTPQKEDYFVLKTKHSGFYETPLHLLLQYLQAQTLILTGLTTDMCILFTASDAYLRDYNLIVPEDGVTTMEEEDHIHALHFMQKRLKAKITTAEELFVE